MIIGVEEDFLLLLLPMTEASSLALELEAEAVDDLVLEPMT